MPHIFALECPHQGIQFVVEQANLLSGFRICVLTRTDQMLTEFQDTCRNTLSLGVGH